MKKPLVTLLLLASLGGSLSAMAAEASLHEVYQAAESGRLIDAQRMMREVLQAHPNSAKAHYVEAELLAKEGQFQQGGRELANAEKLAPGLPFADSHAVAHLKTSLRQPASMAPSAPLAQHLPAMAATAPATNSPWGMLLPGGALIAFIFWASKFMTRRNSQGAVAAPASPAFGNPAAYPATPYAGGAASYGPNGSNASGPGLGSQVLGGLATGAAVGAGVVAGEALLHHFMDGNRSTPAGNQNFGSFDSIPSLPSTPFNDMGGNDFGIADSSSWDDGTSGSDSDWN